MLRFWQQFTDAPVRVAERPNRRDAAFWISDRRIAQREYDVARRRVERDAVGSLERLTRRTRANDWRAIGTAFGHVENHHAAVEVIDRVSKALTLRSGWAHCDLARGDDAVLSLHRKRQQLRLDHRLARVAQVVNVDYRCA